ncbi:MAG TPA: EamA family transporter, partial [Beijerinckiaceae bacterium]|nr:EamA family transporter [Beijerinckiaceae bacterium]
MRHQDNVQASFLLIAALALFTFETLCVRLLNGVATPPQAVLFRSLAQLVVVGTWMLWRRQLPLLRSPHLKLHLARGIVSIVSWYLYYRSFQKLEFSLATLLSFASSLFVVLLAGPVLGERAHPVSWLATLAGFGGIALAAGAGGGAV